MLGSEKPLTFLTTTDRNRARTFYRDRLGLRYLADDGFALVFQLAGDIMLRISPMPEVTPAKFTVLGWQVSDIAAKARELREAGIAFQQYGFPGQDADGIWTAPDGSKVAWFLDPDGNVLSISENVAYT